MLDPMEATKRWRFLKESVDKIKDPLLRESILATYQQRAIKEWGFCPDKTEHKKKKEEIVLEPWQQELHDKIQLALEYGVWDKDEQVMKEAKARMKWFIERGGSLSDLPEDLQNKYTTKLYIDALTEDIEILLKNLEDLDKNT